MEMNDEDPSNEANMEKDFHFQVSNLNDEDDMVDLSSDEGEMRSSSRTTRLAKRMMFGSFKWVECRRRH